MSNIDEFLSGKSLDNSIKDSTMNIKAWRLEGKGPYSKSAMLVQKLLNQCSKVSNELFHSFERELEVHFDANMTFSNFEQLVMEYLGFSSREELGKYFIVRLKAE